MVNALILSSLLLLASSGPTIAEIDSTRFSVTIIFDDHSARGNANAQVALLRAARNHCRGRGDAVSEGSLELNNAPPIRGDRPALELIEIYTCRARN